MHCLSKPLPSLSQLPRILRLSLASSLRNSSNRFSTFSASTTQPFSSIALNGGRHPSTHPSSASRLFSSSSSSAPTASDASEGATMEFKAETLKLLRIVTHSLYTDKEVFVRELISNASDALEKLRFLQATGKASSIVDPSVPLSVKLSADPVANTVTITDTGLGMTREELIDNLGTIAKSGSLEFLENPSLDAKDQANAIIGQFGVGFYSAFVVADKVEVFTRSHQEGHSGWHWTSDGLGTFTIKECQDLPRGTQILCHLKEDCKEFASASKLKSTAEKFSSFVSFPVSLVGEGAKEEAITAQEALWLKQSATDEEHKTFYRYLSGQSWASPLYQMLYHTDAPLSIKALLYVPEEAPSRLFSKNAPESGVALHSRRVLVSKTADQLIPRWMNFVKGVVDCEDMPMNISRENMQDSKLMENLSVVVVRKFLRFLADQSKADAEKFQKFYKQYAQHLKEGFLEDLQKGGKHKEALVSLLRYDSSEQSAGTPVTLEAYISRMLPTQKSIFYFFASNRHTAMSSPYLEQFKSRGVEVLLLFDDIDEFVAMHLGEFKGKKLVAIDAGDEATIRDEIASLEMKQSESSESDIAKPKLGEDEQKELSDYLQSALGSRVTSVKFSERLVNSAAVVTGFLPASIRRMMKATMKENATEDKCLGEMPATLELNPSHPLVTSLFHLKDKSPEVAELVAQQLYDNACIAAGILDEPRNMLDRLNKLLEMTSSFAYHHEEKLPSEESSTSVSSEEKTDQKASA